MSQRIQITYTCPYCDAKCEAEIFRTIWGEVPANRELVFTDKINRLICSQCGRKSLVGASLMFTNSKLHFAVWFEPEYDPQIDADLVKYADMFQQKGPAYSYLQAPPRVREWDDFKELIRKYERREIVTDSQRMRESLREQSAVQSSRGCFGTVVAIAGALVLLAVLAFI